MGRAPARASYEGAVVDAPDALDDLAPAWRELADAAGAAPFSTPELALAWYRHVAKGRPFVVVVRGRGGQVVGVLPLVHRRVGGIDLLRLAGHGWGPVGELVTASPDDLAVGEVVWRTVLDAVPRPVLQLDHHRLPGRGLLALRRAEGWRSRLTVVDPCPIVDLRDAKDVDDVLAARRAVRKTIGRTERLLARDGHTFVVDHLTDGPSIRAALDELAPLVDRAEARHPRFHLLAPEVRPFLLDAVARSDAGEPAATPRLLLSVARVDGEPIGFDLCTRAGAVLHGWITRYDPAAASWSPGHLLLRALCEHGLATGIDAIDLMGGADDYKLRWADRSDELLRVVAAPPALWPLAAPIVEGTESLHLARASLRRRREPATRA